MNGGSIAEMAPDPCCRSRNVMCPSTFSISSSPSHYDCFAAFFKLVWWLLILPGAVTWLHLSSCIHHASWQIRSDVETMVQHGPVQPPFLSVAFHVDPGTLVNKLSEMKNRDRLSLEERSVYVTTTFSYLCGWEGSRYSSTHSYRCTRASSSVSQFLDALDIASWIQGVKNFDVPCSVYRLKYFGDRQEWCFDPSDESEVSLGAESEVSLSKVGCSPSVIGEYHTRGNSPLLTATVTSFSGSLASWLTTNTTRGLALEKEEGSLYQPLVRGFRRNPQKKDVQPGYGMQVISWLSQQPATWLLIFIQTLLAVAYHWCRVDPMSVALDYNRLVQSHEFWRCFSGATAHFEVWHLFFNMSSLYSLGLQLECRNAQLELSSLAFLTYNISLIPLTACLWVLLQHIIRKFAMNRGDKSAVVGFSGVIFVWIVIASLEQDSTCPVFFVPRLCFSTHLFKSDLLHFKWNWAPLVQLLVAHCLLPRVSSLGHLAGVICGFGMHWGWLPLPLMEPRILVPILLLLRLAYAGDVVLFRQSSTLLAHSDTPAGRQSGKTPTIPIRHVVQASRILVSLKMICLGVTIWAIGISKMVVSWSFDVLLWYNFHKAVKLAAASSPGGLLTNSALEVLAQVNIIAAVVEVISLGISFGSWTFLMFTGVIPPLLLAVSVAQSLLLLFSISIASSINGDESGVFGYILSFTTTRPASTVGAWLIRQGSWPPSSWVEGQGHQFRSRLIHDEINQ